MNVTTLVTNTIYFLLVGVLISYLGGTIFRKNERLISGWIALIALILGLISFAALLPSLVGFREEIKLFGYLSWDINLLSWLIVLTGLVLTVIITLYSITYMEEDSGSSKFFPLLILLLISVFGLAFSIDLFNIYLFFELLAISSFALVAFRKDQWEPVEAGIKFLVMSATGSALILLGIALIYKDFGSLNLKELTHAIATTTNVTILWLPMTFFIIGFGIKAAMFPLHTWLPDAHAEAPSGISAMLSGIVIEIGFFTLYRILMVAKTSFEWGMILLWFALLTMTAGNIMALTQKRLKRMLAYSSIAQIGYILLGVSIGAVYNTNIGSIGGVFHIITHAFMKGLAFLCAGALIYRLGSGELEDMRGAGWRMPVTAATFLIAVLSLAGVPPFSGFMSKLLIYQAGIKAGTALGWTASMIAIFNSVLSLGYYLPAVGVLYSKNSAPKVNQIKEVPILMVIALILLAAITIYLGIMPDMVRGWTARAFEIY
jgi:proton-translocating NADH-quinone oxidoreductase chain N